jgi:predicted RND superfamily exporter protein
MIPIMMAIYLNMSFPYFAGDELIFIAYAVVSCVQLGSTIDYAISSTESYIQCRQKGLEKKEAAIRMTELSFPSILTSGFILVVCGYAISIISAIPAIGQVGHLVGRGAIFSVIFVTSLMPFLFRLSDRLITGTFKSRHERRKEKIRHFRKNLREKMAQGRLIDGVKGAEDKW